MAAAAFTGAAADSTAAVVAVSMVEAADIDSQPLNAAEMPAYQIDLDPVHAVIRLTVTAETMTIELAEDIYIRLKGISSSGGPYAAIYDLTMVKHTTIPTDVVRTYARRNPSVPMGRPHVVVAEATAIYGLARLFEMCREHVYGLFETVHTLEEAYTSCEVRPEDFTERR